jgi:hypothetical protein
MCGTIKKPGKLRRLKVLDSVAGGGFVPQSLIDSSELADSTMVWNVKKGQKGDFFIQFSFSFFVSLFRRGSCRIHACPERSPSYDKISTGLASILSSSRVIRIRTLAPFRWFNFARFLAHLVRALSGGVFRRSGRPGSRNPGRILSSPHLAFLLCDGRFPPAAVPMKD